MNSVLSRYKGSLAGGVVGDCIGQVFECIWGGPIAMGEVLADSVEKIESVAAKKPRRQWGYTDDTAMARCVVKSLIENNKLDSKDMARRFMEEYHADPGRGYGGEIVKVFCQLKENDCEDIFGPAARQFNGQGSYGNGAAMRIGPAAVFAHHKQLSFESFRDMVTDISRLTHTHRGAVRGAMLQCYAVNLALKTSQLNIDKFVDDLKSKMKELEESSQSSDTASSGTDEKDTSQKKEAEIEQSVETAYCDKLEKIRQFALQGQEPPPETVVDALGTGIAALDSVPAAIYSFLRATKEINGIKDRNPFERTVIYAISLGGDTDTIASMAGAIAGAYYGIEKIPDSWCKCCEGVYDSLKDAERLHGLVV